MKPAKAPAAVPASAPAAPHKPAAKAVVKRKPISLGELPAECERVLKAESAASPQDATAR